ncbi:platelet endothelial cell adhesion molecule isoform 4-T4 [Symphorus nematophorus]
MGLLLLLTSTLLCSYFHPGRVVSAQTSFTIGATTLSIEPSDDVRRGTNVTLRCQALVSSSGQEDLSREYTIYRDSSVIYTKTSSTSEDLLYPLPEARVSNTGKYSCSIKIGNKQKTSATKRLTVTGLSKPVLRLNNTEINEGDELTAICTAPGETGSIFFFFYEDSKEIKESLVNSNQAEAKFRPISPGRHDIRCAYTVLVAPESFKSENSSSIPVLVRELHITTVLEIFPQNNIYEGDQLVISCTISNSLRSSEKTHLYLSQGTKLLSSGDTKVNHTMDARAQDPGEFECKLEIEHVVKVATKKISVTELFSVPTLTMSPAEVFQGDYMRLTCKSSYASERIHKEELIYTLDPPQSPLSNQDGVFSGRVLQFDFNYTCVAQAKGIMKHSKTLTVRPKVHVSFPRISVDGKAVLGQPFKIRCQSDFGSLPINYTLVKEYDLVSSSIVERPNQQALFTVTINKADEINKYLCEAKNGPKDGLLSKRLNATVVVPLSDPTMTTIPSLSDISEGVELYLICGIVGSPPVTFNWYRVGNERPVFSDLSNVNHSYYKVVSLSKEHSGEYYCEAYNYANNIVRSERITIDVRMALWKKVLIGGSCLLAVTVLVVGLVVCFKSKRGRETYSPPASKREAAAELSVKPSSPKSDDSLTVNLTHDTEVYKAATVKVDRATVSVWTKRPPEDDVANDEESSMVSNEPDVEYTEVVHPRPVDPARGAADHHDYQGSVEYAALNGDQPEINHFHPEINSYQDLPEPVV